MSISKIQYKQMCVAQDQILALYSANGWSAAEKPKRLYDALMASHSLVSAWDGDKLVSLGNAITDRHLVVYYSHLLVLPKYQRYGISSTLLKMLISKYHGFHQQVLIADGRAVEFYQKCGFDRAGMTEPMWIYQGKDR
jgi:GNAT superfamily N-acetyltransferase